MIVKIKEMAEYEKPRERLINYGVKNLSNNELISIILKCGTKNISSKDLADEILKQYKSIENLKDIKISSLNKIKGIGTVKACQLLASIELGRRVYYVKNIGSVIVNSTTSVFETYKSEFDNINQEKFCALYLDTKKNVISFKTLFKGTLDKSIVHPREVFKEAILLSASAIIVMHNHPSGDVTPSKQDIEITNSLIYTGNMLGIKLVDHIIFGKDRFYSFYENIHNTKISS